MSDLIPDIQLQDNTDQRLACVLVLDGSTSMMEKNDEGKSRIDLLNEGLKTFENELKNDDLASTRVQIYVLRIGGNSDVEVVSDWTDAINWTAPQIEANGTTPLGAGAKEALKQIEFQKSKYQANGITYNRPWLILITDGEPNDAGWERVADECREAENDNKVSVFPIGVDGSNIDSLSRFANKSAIPLKNLAFNELFVWLSRSVSMGSQAAAGDNIQLPAIGWGDIEV